MGDQQQTSTWLVVAEVSGIQDWIVGHATELRVIRGGSVLLDETFRALQADLTNRLGEPSRPSQGWPPGCRWQLIARSSGRLSALVADGEDVAGLTGVIRARLARDLPGLAARVSSVVVSGAEQAGESAFVAARRRARQRGTGQGTVLPGSYHLGTETCDASGTETASAAATPEGWFLSPMSERRQRADAVGVTRDDLAVERRMDRVGRATISTRYAGYVAVVCADGNAIGARFRGLREPVEVERQSQLIEAGIDMAEEAAYEAAVNAHLAAGGDFPLQINPVVRAGDDLRYVLPAHVALAFAKELTSAAPDLQACAGVLLCHASLPFSHAHDAAEALLARAKQASRRLEQPEPYVAFAVETASGVGAELGLNRLSCSPYRATELAALMAAATTLDASSSQLRNVMAALNQGGRVAEREWALHCLGSSAVHHRALADLWRALGCTSVVESEPFPTRQDRHGGAGTEAVPVSPVGDLLLLRQLVSDPSRDEVPA